MPFRIDSDVNRFKDIVRKKVKSNLGKYISSENIIGSQGGKAVKIPINNIDLPRFSFGGQGGGSGMGGDLDVGDPMPGQGQPGQGSGKAGNEEGDHTFSAEFSQEELVQILAEELELPDIEEKAKGKVESTRKKYNSISNQGVDGLRSFRRTYKETLKRSISSGTYDLNDPVLIPIKGDYRYRTSKPIVEESTSICCFFIQDISGSMTAEQQSIIKAQSFWITAFLEQQYKGLDTRYIVHDTVAYEKSKEEFFGANSNGGTSIFSGLELVEKIMSEEYPFSENCVYVFSYGDGDSWDSEDNIKSVDILKNKILPNCNLFCYGQTTSPNGSGDFYNVVGDNLSDHDNFIRSKIDSRDDIMRSIKDFLGKGK